MLPAVLILLLPVVLCDDYYEKLDLTHLPNNDLAAELSFTTLKPITGLHWTAHYDFFPKTIGDLVQKYHVQEFHLSLTQGFWRIRQWGAPVSKTGAPTGAQIWAWFSDDVKNVDENWRNFIHALSGLFCASFSQIDEKFTVIPEYAYRPEGASNKKSDVNNKFVRYGVLPSENVCTENLTPWKKLLPCKSGGGIGRLLNPLKLYSANFHSLSVDFRRVCLDESCLSLALELSQTIVVVFDNRFANSITNLYYWSLMSVFGNFIDKECHLSEESVVTVKIPSKNEPKFSDNLNVTTVGDFLIAKYDVHENLKHQNYFNVKVDYSKRSVAENIKQHPVSIHSYSAGTGQRGGTLMSRLENTNSKPVKVLYSHVIPWYLRVYFHTLSIVCDNQQLKPDFLVYQPALDRQRPHYVEIAFNLEANSVCKVGIEYEKLLLRWNEYPPDANHGFYIPAPSISFFYDFPDYSVSVKTKAYDNQQKGKFFRIYGEILLVNLPTPDFSMPYNVICLVCTVVALAFGPIHNLTTRRLVIKDPDEIKKKSLKAKIQAVLVKLKSNLKRSGPTGVVANEQ